MLAFVEVSVKGDCQYKYIQSCLKYKFHQTNKPLFASLLGLVLDALIILCV